MRCFEDGDITHVEGSVDPVRDAETIETELMLADLDSLEKRLPALQKKAKGNDREAQSQVSYDFFSFLDRCATDLTKDDHFSQTYKGKAGYVCQTRFQNSSAFIGFKDLGQDKKKLNNRLQIF
ncbi:Ribosome-binding ATPase YchF [Entomobacter blattae]|uniref:Ribosome-binding ATPase YchF n=1 Tax=Entomobacter blattae TaxID=2762277 RepID=A0A7H1NNR1_9PROT|nr:Ribosome-binding ATPase YchF [Entomobacter blattae]